MASKLMASTGSAAGTVAGRGGPANKALLPEGPGIHRTAGPDQEHRGPDLSASANAHHGPDQPLLHVERQERALRRTPPDDQVVPSGVEPRVLQVVLVLVGPEPGDLVVGDLGAQHAQGGGPTL